MYLLNRVFMGKFIHYLALIIIISSCTSFQEEDVPDRLSVSVTELSYSKAGESHQVKVSSGTKWDVTSSPEWVSLQSISSDHSPYEWTVNFSSSANDDYNREGTITIKAGSDSAEISVTQEGRKGKYIAVESVSLSPTELTLTEGENASLKYTISPANASIKDVTWESSNTSVATVSSSGVVTAKTVGSATITVSTNDGGKQATCTVTVSVPIPEVIDLGLSVKWASFNLGATQPEEAGDFYAWGDPDPYYSSLEPLTWKKGKESGYDWTSYKWCKGSENTLTKYCTDPSYGNNGFTDYKIILDPEDDAAHVHLGDKWRLPTQDELEELKDKCTTKWTTMNGVIGRMVTGPNGNSIFFPALGGIHRQTPKYEGDSGYYWSSSLCTESVREGSPSMYAYIYMVSNSVSSDYHIMGYNRGRVGGSVRPVYGDPVIISVSSVNLNKTSHTLAKGESASLVATVYPSNATNKSVTWSSSNTSVATVSSSGIVTAKSVGLANITVTTNDGGKKATCLVTVQAGAVAVTGVTLDESSLLLIEGDTFTLTETVTPSNATNKSVNWSSSNTSVATVSSVGVVTAKSAGSATITVKTIDGEKTATCVVTVKAKTVNVTGVSLNKTSISMTVGDAQALTATVVPSNATDKSVSWSSNNTSVATVSTTGTITARGIGDCIIEATAGSFYSRCYVSVYSKDDVSTPLSFSIVSGGEIWWTKAASAVGMEIVESSSNCSIEYQINGQNWIQLNPGEHFSVRSNDIVSFRGDNSGYGYYVTDGSNFSCSYHSFGGSADFIVYGNIMSLINKYNFQTLSTLPTDATFAGLFDHSGIVSSTRLVLPTGNATDACYLKMFSGCDKLMDMPSLPASIVSSRSYYRMFENCVNLSSITNLPALSLGYMCYGLMFVGCKMLTTAPSLPSEILSPGCYQQMFQNCSSLNYLEAFFTTTPSSAYTLGWMRSVASTGTFIKNKKAGWDVSGENGIPQGWTVEYK